MTILKGALRYHFGRSVSSRKIFEMGTGRSGTHWLGYILDSHPEIAATVEKPPIFTWVTEMATDPDTRSRLMPKLIRRYRYEHSSIAPMHYADKSHPTIWIAERLADAFPEARFIGIRRGQYATVASMLRHSGVMQWIHDWKKLPVPNAFLGIDEETAAIYDELPLAARCALRWKSHQVRLAYLERRLADRILVLDYETLQEETRPQLKKIEELVGLGVPIPEPEVKRQSLERWRSDLSSAEISDIDRIVESKPSMEWVNQL